MASIPKGLGSGASLHRKSWLFRLNSSEKVHLTALIGISTGRDRWALHVCGNAQSLCLETRAEKCGQGVINKSQIWDP